MIETYVQGIMVCLKAGAAIAGFMTPIILLCALGLFIGSRILGDKE